MGNPPASQVATLALYHSVVPAIPASYRGDQRRFDGDMQLLKVRREILERTVAIRESQALVIIHHADAADRWERLNQDAQLPSAPGGPQGLTTAQRRRLTGQAMLAIARADGLQERIQQLEMEIMAFAATLTRDGEGPPAEGG